MIQETMRLFNGVPKTNQNKASNHRFRSINKEALKRGYLVTPAACTKDLENWLHSQRDININTTFYKNWQDIISKDRLELFVDQILHYMSTYGTNHQGTAYIPNDDPIDIPLEKYKVIEALSNEEIIERCESLISSGMALDKDTIEAVLYIFKELDHKVDIDIVKNKEVRLRLFSLNNMLPTDPTEMVRLLVYRVTDRTLLIKDKATIAHINLACGSTCPDKSTNVSNIIKEFGIEKLSSVFFRFKPIFLALKKNPLNKTVINKLRKAANKHHRPMTVGFFENLLLWEEFVDL